MHVRFETEMSAASAVAKSGQFVDGNVMIGVAKYDPDRFQACVSPFAVLCFLYCACAAGVPVCPWSRMSL